jgi:restriction endonuclease S subunit
MSKLIVAPEDWPEFRLSDVALLIPGAPTHDDPVGTTPVLKPKNIVAGQLSGETDRVDDNIAEHKERYQVHDGDVLCTRTGSIGRVGLVTKAHVGSIFGSGLICIRPSSDLDSRFLVFYFSHPAVVDWLSRNAKGTAVPSISRNMLNSLPISLPSLATQRSIGQTLSALNEKIEAHHHICETTASIRDALLPLLFSGSLAPPLPRS